MLSHVPINWSAISQCKADLVYLFITADLGFNSIIYQGHNILCILGRLESITWCNCWLFGIAEEKR